MADQRHVFDLDTLLDTRLATIATLKPELASRIVSDPELYAKYKNRPNDLFVEFELDSDEFEKAYRARDANILTKSLPTTFLFEMINIGGSLLNLRAQEPHNVENIEFAINTYPYHDLSEAEVSRILDAIAARIQAIIGITSIYVSPEQMSPSYIRASNYNAIYFYNFRDWLKEHYHKDKVTEATVGIIPGTCIYSSAQFVDLDQLKNATEYQNPQGENTSPVLGMQVMFSPYFRLEPMSLDYLSLVDKDKVINDVTK